MTEEKQENIKEFEEKKKKQEIFEERNTMFLGLFLTITLCIVFPICYYVNFDNANASTVVIFTLFSFFIINFFAVGKLMESVNKLRIKHETSDFNRKNNTSKILLTHMKMAVFFYGGYDFKNPEIIKIVYQEIDNYFKTLEKNPEEHMDKILNFVENNDMTVYDIILKINKKLEENKT